MESRHSFSKWPLLIFLRSLPAILRAPEYKSLREALASLGFSVSMVAAIFLYNLSGSIISIKGAVIVGGALYLVLLFTYSQWRAKLKADSDEAVKTQLGKLPRIEVPDIGDEDIGALAKACAAGECVLFSGTGLSAQAGYPTWSEYANQLLKAVVKLELIARESAEDLQIFLNQGQADLVVETIAASKAARPVMWDLLRKCYGDERGPSPAHLLLGQINFSGAITSSLDRLVEDTFSFKNKPTYLGKDAERLLDALSRPEFFLFKLFGDIESRTSVVLSMSEFKEAIGSNRFLAKFLESLLFSRTLFLIGVSLEGIERIFERIPGRINPDRKHYALVSVKEATWREKANFLERRFGVKVLAYHAKSPERPSVVTFLEKLKARIDATDEPTPAKQQSRLKSVDLENIGPFDKLHLDFDLNWNILLGDNGVGKSSILKAIAVGIYGDDAKQDAWRLIKSGCASGTITLTTDQDKWYRTTIHPREIGEVSSAPKKLNDIEHWLAMGFPPLRTMSWIPLQADAMKERGRPVRDDVLPLVQGGPDPRLDSLKQWIVRLDHLIKDAIASNALSQQPSETAGPVPVLKSSYEWLRDDFFRVMADVTPGVKIEFVEVKPKTEEIVVRTDDGLVPIEAVSQGTISLLGWVGILLQRLYEIYGPQYVANRGRVGEKGDELGVAPAPSPLAQYAIVLIDEIDAHMHPKWQQSLVQTLQRLFPEVQFVATTHSPLIVAGMPAEQVVRLVRNKEGLVETLDVDPESLMGRADQVLTGELFDLQTTIDPKTKESMAEYQRLLGNSHRDTEEEKRFQELRAILRFRIPPSGETPAERRAQELLDALLMDQFDGRHEEIRGAIMEKARKLFQGLQKETKV